MAVQRPQVQLLHWNKICPNLEHPLQYILDWPNARGENTFFLSRYHSFHNCVLSTFLTTFGNPASESWLLKEKVRVACETGTVCKTHINTHALRKVAEVCADQTPSNHSTSLFIADSYNYHANATGNAIAGWWRRKTPAGEEEAVGVITAVMECTNQGDYQTWYRNKCVCGCFPCLCAACAL